MCQSHHVNVTENKQEGDWMAQMNGNVIQTLPLTTHWLESRRGWRGLKVITIWWLDNGLCETSWLSQASSSWTGVHIAVSTFSESSPGTEGVRDQNYLFSYLRLMSICETRDLRLLLNFKADKQWLWMANQAPLKKKKIRQMLKLYVKRANVKHFHWSI